MKIELNSEDDLDEYIICPKCHTLQKEIEVAEGSRALCSKCRMTLYSHDSGMVDHGLALSITGLIFFVLANAFPIIDIHLLGSDKFITIISMISSLVDTGYYVVAIFVTYLIVIFPLMIFLLYIAIFLLMKLDRGVALSRDLLILLARIQPWHMSDIFLVSILVAMVKLLGMAQIHFGVSFWALIFFVVIDIYMTKTIQLGELWKLRKQVYGFKSRGEVSGAVS